MPTLDLAWFEDQSADARQPKDDDGRVRVKLPREPSRFGSLDERRLAAWRNVRSASDAR
jgi:hypothetical protein